MASTNQSKEWSRVFKSFTDDPYYFLDNDSLTKEDLIDLILKLLFSEDFEENGKLQCFSVLQDYSSILLSDRDQTLIVIDTLKKLIHKPCEERSEFFYKGQVLITMTTLMLTILDEMIEEETEQLVSFVKLFDALIQLVLMANNGENYLLREAACDCLTEMELFYPGLLRPMLETLRDLCISENSLIYEKYSVLFSTVLKHQQSAQISPSSPSQKLVDYIIKHKQEYKSVMMSTPLNSTELKQAISFLLDHLPFISNFSASTVMRDCIHIAERSEHFPISIFKPIVLNYLQTYDMQLLHVIMQMQMKFKEELFSEYGDEQLLLHLVNLSYLPILASSQRLLYLDWLEYYFAKNISSTTKINSQLYLKIYPNSSDNWDIIQKKLNLFSSMLKANPCLFNRDAHKIYWDCLSAVYNTAQFVMTKRSAAAIFRGLFLYMKSYSAYTETQTNIQRIIFSFTKYQPSYYQHSLDFIRCIKKEFLESSFPNEIQKELVQVIISLDYSPSLQWYIRFLNNLVSEVSNISLLKDVCVFLHSLLMSTTICEDGDWIFGNHILRICRTLLRYQDFRHFFIELSEVLHLITKAHSDIDIREEARFLYMLLMTLSPQKIKSVFEVMREGYEKQHISSLSMLDTDFECDKILCLNTPVIHLKKTDKFIEEQMEDENKEELIPKNTLKPYRAFIGSDDFKMKVSLPYCLHLDSLIELQDRKLEFQKLYCIHIVFESSALYDDINEILLPYLPRDKSEECEITFTPKSFEPTSIGGSVTFSSENGSTYRCPIETLTVDFENYFLPLPVPLNYRTNVKHWRKRVFDDLWLSFSKSSNSGADSNPCQESVVWLALSATKVDEKLSRYSHLIVESDKDVEKQISKVGIFLSIGCHILLKFEALENDDDCVVRIMVDNWQTLGLLNLFILSLEGV